jgi:hypothetical protein
MNGKSNTRREGVRSLTVGLAAAALACVASLASAHHSFAVFDPMHPRTLVGTIKEVQWVNPHVWIVVSVPREGGADDWTLEAPGVAEVKRNGWSRDTLKSGDKVTITIAPKLDGSHAGAYMSAITASGKTLGATANPITTPTPDGAKGK